MYTKNNIEYYASLLEFTQQPEIFNVFNLEYPVLSDKVTIFHIKVTLLGAIEEIIKDKIPVTFLLIRDYLMINAFNNKANIIALEKRLVEYLPQLIDDKLVDENFNLTSKGTLMIRKRIERHYVGQNSSLVIN